MPPESTATDIVGLWPGTSYTVAVSALRGREEGPAAVIVARTGQGLTQPLGCPPPVPFQTPRPPSPTSASPQNSSLPLQSPLSPEPLPSPIPLPLMLPLNFHPLISQAPTAFSVDPTLTLSSWSDALTVS